MSPLDRVLAAFPNAQQTKPNEWKVRCPVHGADNNPSLSIGPADNGGVVLHCFAGCANQEIVSRVNLTMADLMPPPLPKPATKQIIKTYPYTDATDTIIFEVVRYEPKDFRQRRPDGKGGHIWNLKGVSMCLYRLPEIAPAIDGERFIFLVEGEKDADRVRSLGLVATTNAGGAEKWKQEYTEALRGAHVILMPDNDGPGRKHMNRVAAALSSVAASVRILDLPGLPPKGDVSDWINADPAHDAHMLHDLASEAPIWTPGAPQSAPEPTPPNIESKPGRSFEDLEKTDGGNAYRFVMLFGEDVRYVPGLGWRGWSGSRWEAGDHIAARLARETVNALFEHAGQMAESVRLLDDEIDRKVMATRAEELLKHARKSDSAPRIAAIASLAKDDRKIAGEVSDFEVKPWKVGFPNGTWDKGEFREHRREDHIEHLTGVPFDSGADRSDWYELLGRMTGNDEDLARMLQDVAGYAFSGASSMRILPWFYGTKGTGKSTFAELLQTALGQGSAKVLDWSLLSGDREAERLGATIRGTRAIFLNEAGKKRLDAEILKMLSGGDRLPGRDLFQNMTYSVTPTWALIALSNDPPNMSVYDDALRDRLRALPFLHPLAEGGPLSFTNGEKIESYRRRSDTPLIAGFVSWAVEGLARIYQTQKIHQAEAATKHTSQFWSDADPLTPFWEQIEDGEKRLKEGIRAGELRNFYLTWCVSEGIRKPLSTTAWGAACHARGLIKARVNTAGPDHGAKIWKIGDGGLFSQPADLEEPESCVRVSKLGTVSPPNSVKNGIKEPLQNNGQLGHTDTRPVPKPKETVANTNPADEPEVF